MIAFPIGPGTGQQSIGPKRNGRLTEARMKRARGKLPFLSFKLSRLAPGKWADDRGTEPHGLVNLRRFGGG